MKKLSSPTANDALCCLNNFDATDVKCNKQIKYCLLYRKLRGTWIVRGTLEPAILQRLIIKLLLPPLMRVSGDPCITRTTSF